MKLNEYQQEARETAIYPEELGLLYTTLGLAGESGEVAEKVKKMIRDGTSLEDCRESLINELGDVLWYVANLAHELKTTLEEVAYVNLDKLKDRQAREVLKGSGEAR